MNDTVDVNAVLEEAAQATAAAGKKERKPKAEVAGTTVGSAEPKKERKPREPKAPKLYPQWNEDGSPMLGEDGQQVMAETRMKKPKAPKAPRLDADGNPITRSRVLPSDDSSTISWVEEKAAGYKGARAEFCAMRSQGQTIASYLAAGGDKGFLRFYVRDGAAVVTAPAATE